ncbi:hypothetical protein HMPREF0208_03603 [Citrobacter koseri]|uniref:Uncharacterized protein n=1 Tax=Citrobacter koseri TaxID=545 RepID=A0A2X2WPP9_CITKO|nr:hypothetical protein HMPREF3207_04933 [Citrobacter koseri]KWZ98172.1 hypothetical protein HMPREF3220_02727 [Citrobacter koseri]KXB41613.1 hypothetical protein HMPREF0208_03603 [Citrobacter koseri]SQB42424.1 Uncharacterised protein [Citrobacter koseri]
MYCIFNNWHEKYKKHTSHSHRATTQYFGSVSRMFVAKAQGNGSHFTEMKNEEVNRQGARSKRRGV